MSWIKDRCSLAPALTVWALAANGVLLSLLMAPVRMAVERTVPQVALEYGRKTISAYERPSIDAVEQEMMNPGGENKAA